MARRVRIYPYNQHSKSAKALRDAIGNGTKLIKRENSRFVARPDDVIINWGASDCPHEVTINSTIWVETAANKLSFFAQMEGIDVTPKWWARREDIPNEEYPIVCRTILNGHSGAGIVIANGPEELVDAPLYVKYIKKQQEYRVHVGDNGESIICVQRKARRLDHDEPNWQVRNHANGFIYAREDANPTAQVLDVAERALALSGLNFGAVDVIWNEHHNKAYVLEINTAPGLEGATVNDYANYFKERL